MLGIEFGIGTLLALVTFLRSEVGGRHTKEDLLRVLAEEGKAEQFREWLRQKDQADLIQLIETSKSELISELASLGRRFDEFAIDALRVSGDLERRFRDLNDRIRPPVLSSLSLPTRPRANVAIKGREREREWLVESTGDVLVSGQPGSGKTELLQSFANEQNARFLITDNPDEAAAAVLASRLPVVIVDDAGTKRDLIIRLRHLRTERGHNFRIIAIGWPFDKASLQPALQVNDAATLELEGLPRSVIAEIITDIAGTQRVTVSDEFIRVVAKQARGMPGLAAALSLATIAAGGEALVSGELLLRDLTPFLLSVSGPQTVQLLGAFACGGKSGISIASVARILGMNILQVTVDAQRVALAGVLEQTGKETLCVQPGFLRSALLKETFFSTDGLSLPWSICEALIQAAEDPVLGYLELLHARARAGASVPIDRLRKITAQVGDSRLWDAMAALDEMSCEWVVESAPALSTEIKRAALHYVPSRIIPILLGTAVGETRPLNSYPEADIRLLEDWINGGSSDAVERRRALFDGAISWMISGGDSMTALSAVRLSFGLDQHESDSDPADPKTFRWRESLLSLDAAKAVFQQWRPFVGELTRMNTPPWLGVTGIVEKWLRNDTRRGGILPDDYMEFLISSGIQMLGDLLPLAADNQAALRWLYFRSKDLGILIEPCPVDPDFLILFPKERLDGDWEKNERDQTQAAQELAVRWNARPFRQIVDELGKWQEQAKSLGTVWLPRAPAFSTKLAEIRLLTSEELSLVIRNLPPPIAGPFLDAALSNGQMTPELFEEVLAQPDFHGFLVQHTLTCGKPDFYEQLKANIPHREPLVKSLCLRGEVIDEMLQRLLQHEDAHLRREVALHMFRLKRKIPASLQQSWHEVIVHALVACAGGYEDNPPYDLTEILAFDQSIAQAVLEGILDSGTQIHGHDTGGLMYHLVLPLKKEERKALLHRCKHLSHSPLPRLLVGRDEDLYRELLSIPELKGSYYKPLIGDPNEGNWAALAKIALVAGHSHRDVSHCVNSGGYSWQGRLSNYYQEWVDRFEKLRQYPDPDIQRIADEGLKWSTAQRDAERRDEKREEIDGWD